MSRSDRILAELKATRLAREAKPAPAAPRDPTRLILGRDSKGAPVSISAKARLEHAHVIGTTGSGKSKFLEHCILQDIAMGHGVCLVDPHGNHPDSLYRAVLAWVGTHKVTRPIHIIDPNAGTHATGFNPLDRPDEETALSVISGTVREAVARAWGDEDTDQKPTMTRVLEGTFTTLAEQGLTLVEAEHLYRRDDAFGIRALLRSQVVDRVSRSFLERLDSLAGDLRSLDQETIAAVNRLAKFVRAPAIRAALGQTETQIDFRAALDEGHIILVNLSGGTAVYEEDADLVGRLLVRSLFFHAKRRAHTERPFFLYLDECHRYLSGDVPSLLAEARKYGLGAILAHQYLRQLGEPDELMRHAVLNNTNLKVVFRLQNPTEAAELAEAVVAIDYEKPLQASIKPTVIGHKRTELKSANVSEQSSTSRGVGRSRGEVTGETYSSSSSVSVSEGEGRSRSTNQATNTSRGRSTGETQSVGQSFGSSRASMIGSGANTSTGFVTDPTEYSALLILPSEPPVISESAGEGSSASESFSEGSSEMQSSAQGLSNARSESTGRSSGVSEGTTNSRAVSHSEAENYGTMHATTRATSESEAVSHGVAKGSGTAETFESLYADLPGQFHSKENVLSMAGDALRSLPSGMAYASFVSGETRWRDRLAAPFVKSVTLSNAEFAALRTALLDRSPSALPIAEAIRRVEEREHLLIATAEAFRMPAEPASFRAPRKPKSKPPSG